MSKAKTKVETTDAVEVDEAAEPSSDSAEVEDLRAQLEEAKKVLSEQADIINQQNAIIQNTQETFAKLKESTIANTAVGKDVIEINERMKEETKVFYPQNPLDPGKTHVPVCNPVTGKVDQVKVGEWVTVNKAVAEILNHSANADNLTLMLQQEKAAELEKAEKVFETAE